MIGQQFDNYRIEKHLDQGGMADIYLARDLTLQRLVALKVLKPELARDAEFVARFHREIRVTAQINHPHMVHVYGTGNAPGGRPYLAMQYVRGGSLHDQLKRLKIQNAGMTAPAALRLIRQIADALSAAHAGGIVHRDIKPTNILLHENGMPLLSDLGIASVKNATTQLTRTGTVLGTPHYMSPEQSQNQKIDGRSDIYSLGVILYELLAQKRPFEADSPLAVLHQHIYEQPEPLDQIKPELATATYAVVAACLHKEPDNRYSTAGELTAALDRAIQAEESDAFVPPAWPKAAASSYPSSPTPTRPMKRHPPRWVYPATAVLILLAVGASFWLRAKSDKPLVVLPPVTEPAPPTLNPSPIIPPTKTILAANHVPTQILTATQKTAATAVPTASLSPTEPPAIAIAASPTLLPLPPDGLIAYACGAEGARQIYLSTPDGRLQSPLPNQPANSIVPNFSHDGRQIAYRSDATGLWQIYASNIDGSNFRQITDDAFNNYEPTWSPDGTHFVFASDRSGSRELYWMTVDGAEQTRLTFTDAFNDDPAWSSNGWVAYESNQDGRYNIRLLAPPDTQSQLLLNIGNSSTTPAWSHDGERLAFEVSSEGSFHIWVINRDGTNMEPITSSGTVNARPAWSPDGQRIAFHSNYQSDGGSKMDIWIVNRNTKLLQRLTTRGDCTNPAWSWGESGESAAATSSPPVKTPTPICALAKGQTAAVTDKARLWSGPDVNANKPLLILPEGTAVTIISGPLSGHINYDTDDVGWWWEVAAETGEQGWLWQNRLMECQE